MGKISINYKLILLIFLVLAIIFTVVLILPIFKKKEIVTPDEPNVPRPVLYTEHFPRELMLYDSPGHDYSVKNENDTTFVKVEFSVNKPAGMIYVGYLTSLENNHWEIVNKDPATNTIKATKTTYVAEIKINKTSDGSKINLDVSYRVPKTL